MRSCNWQSACLIFCQTCIAAPDSGKIPSNSIRLLGLKDSFRYNIIQCRGQQAEWLNCPGIGGGSNS